MKANRVLLTYLGITLLLFTLSTCSPLKPRSPWEKVYVYECDERKLFLVEMNERDESVMLTISGKRYTLPKVPSASGVKYSDGKNTFWSKGESALVELDERIAYQNCRLKR